MPVRDFEDSTLWRISAFERVRRDTGTSGFTRLAGPSLLPTTLLADLRRLDADPGSNDVLEVVAACLRHHEAALLCLQFDDVVWPITLFPREGLYHSPRNMLDAPAIGLRGLEVLAEEPPGVRPPGHWMHERIAGAEHYRALPPLLWSLALNGPRQHLLAEIGGVAAYRAVRSPAEQGLATAGALGPAVERLRRESTAVRHIATWPGMSLERACRLVNALYLTSSLLVTRTHPAARAEPPGRAKLRR